MTLTAPVRPADARTQRATLVIAAVGTLLALIAFTAPLSTMAAVASSLGADASGRIWILSSMSIGLGAALLTAGAVADNYGRRGTFVVGALILVTGALASAVAPNTLVFVLARVVQGVGGAAIIAAGLGLIAHAFPAGPSRARASGIWGASVGGGIMLGPLLAVGLDRVSSWRACYWLLAGLTFVLVLGARRCLAESRSDDRRRLDLFGATLLVAGISTLLAALVIGRGGWSQPAPLVLLGTSVISLVGFVAVEHYSDEPMLDLRLFRAPAFLSATLAAFATGAGIIALMSYLAGFLAAAYQTSSTSAALLLTAWSATSVVAALLARRLPARWTGRFQLAGGLVFVALGQLALTGLAESSSELRLIPGLLLAGLASGVINAALGREAVASVPAGSAGMGSGANNTARYVGSALGVTVVSVIAVPAHGVSAAALIAGWNTAAVLTAVISMLGAVVVVSCRPNS
ncbi:MFS family permease [Rhodococcus sp. 27YEA15]|uniref:MFS transporter n=1 Tax=Rhodococcus sp. 27YEA15 TaxID=3156259 RepID=UPI003C7D6757